MNMHIPLRERDRGARRAEFLIDRVVKLGGRRQPFGEGSRIGPKGQIQTAVGDSK